MEVYLLLAFLLFYVLMALFVSKIVMQKIWTLAFMAAFVITAVSIGFLRFNNQDVMMNASELNWYYILYLFGSLSVVLGLINLWMYRKPLVELFISSDDNKKEEDGD